MRRPLIVPLLATVGYSLMLGACTSPIVGSPCPIPDNATPEQRTAALKRCIGQLNDMTFEGRLKKDVDILFLIDNSPSMTPKQQALATNIPKFIETIDATGADYHVGIATSDIGSITAPGSPWGGNAGACDTFEGDDGVLQNVPCSARVNVSTDARAACMSLCTDPKYVPTDGKRYISKVGGVTNVPADLKPDPMKPGMMLDNGPSNAFKCMALVGDGGCGIEGQLEGAKRALDGHRTENTGFLRSNAALAIIFISDEDDCSVQMSKRAENDPNNTTDCVNPDQNASYRCFGIDYRCLARSVQCNEAMNTPGVKTGCKERPDNYLEPIDKYYKFFNALRPDKRILVSGIWTQPSIDNGGRVEIATGSGTTTPFLNRAGGAGASCAYSQNQSVYGQAQVRLSSFARQFKDDKGVQKSVEVSICDIQDYPNALQKISDAIQKILEVSCLPSIPKKQNGQPICLVGDVDEATPNALPDVAFPVCSTTCCNGWANAAKPLVTDPAVIAACTPETTEACFCAVPSTTGQCSGSVVAGVWRKGGGLAPAGRQVNFKCSGGG